MMVPTLEFCQGPSNHRKRLPPHFVYAGSGQLQQQLELPPFLQLSHNEDSAVRYSLYDFIEGCGNEACVKKFRAMLLHHLQDLVRCYALDQLSLQLPTLETQPSLPAAATQAPNLSEYRPGGDTRMTRAAVENLMNTAFKNGTCTHCTFAVQRSRVQVSFRTSHSTPGLNGVVIALIVVWDHSFRCRRCGLWQ